MTTRALVRIPVPPGAPGVTAVWGALPAALGNTGPAIAPVPVRSATVSDDYLTAVIAAARPGAPLTDPEVAVVLTTSGSTGAPRGVELTASAVRASADAVARRLGVDIRETAWVVAIPVTGAGGFNVVARAWLSGNEPAVLASVGGARPYDPSSWVGAVNEARERAPGAHLCTSVVPTMLHRTLADVSVVAALREFTTILVGGARLDPTLFDRASAAGLRVVRTYGMTETCGGCVLDGRPLDGVHVRIDDGDQIWIKGPMLMSRYRAEPDLTDQRLVDGWLATGDLGSYADGVLEVSGRLDDIVQVKGTAVSALAVAGVVSATDGVDECEVVAVPAGPDGHRLVAFIVGSVAEAVIESRVRAALGLPAVPAVQRLASLPRLANGKCDRGALLRLVAT
jgi:O-succinylbenzoic acid--CoA ligase